MFIWYITIFILTAYLMGLFDKPPEFKANNAAKAYTDSAKQSIRLQQHLFNTSKL